VERDPDIKQLLAEVMIRKKDDYEYRADGGAVNAS
jgi:hypothetical protein